MSPGENSASQDSDIAFSTAQTIDPSKIPPPLSKSNAAFESREFQLPGYRFTRQLGAGGSGLVFAAIQEALGREVAVKILNPIAASRPDAVDRFRAEATAIARLRHPGIVQIFEAGEFDSHPYLVMELIRGGTLADALADGPLAVERAAECLKRVAEAVGMAHAAGIVHRDLKPANVLLEKAEISSSGSASGRDSALQWQPKVADFGLAKDLADTSRTATGVLIGTPSFMAPEQASGDPHAMGPQTDVYALGATLYACLTGHPPFRGTTVMETLDLVRKADPVPPRTLRSALPRDLDTICLKCLRKAPAERYPSASELAADLDRFLTGKPIVARPVGPIVRTFKWCRRQPAIAALIFLAVLGPAATAVGVIIHNAKLNEALASEIRERERADANYREARLAISRMLSRTAEQSATPIPQLRELERKQAEDALAFFRAVINEGAETDPEIRYQLAEAIFQLGTRTEEVGDRTRAMELFGEAMAAFDALSAANPTDRRFQSSRALARGQRGFSLLGSDPAKAEANLLAAVELYTTLHAEYPEVAEYAHRLGQFTHNLGTLRRRADRFDEAEAFFRKAIAAHQDGMKAQPPTPVRRVMLSDSWIGLGLAAWHTKRYPDAEEAYGEADGELTRALVEHPGNADASLSLGTLHINWGLLAQDEGKPELAIARFDRAVEMLEDLLKREPKMNRLRLPLYNAHGARHAQLANLGKFAEAAADSERQTAFANPDKVAVVWSQSAKMWAKAGRKKECLEALAKSRAVDSAAWVKIWDQLEADDAFRDVRAEPDWKQLAPQRPAGKQ